MRRLWNATLCLAGWNESGRIPEDQKPYRLFLLIHTILWCLPGFVMGGIYCLVTMPAWYDVVTILVTTAGVPGMVIGFFGGALFLMRNI